MVEKRKLKVAGIALLLLSFAIASVTPLLATNQNVIDTDPGSYVIVVFLMLFVMIAFSGKEDLEPNSKPAAFLVGIALAIAYLAAFSYLRGALSQTFLSLRIDALLMPLSISALIVVIFGADGLYRLRRLPIYAAFASPVILMPLLRLDGYFAGVNAYLVYGFLRFLGAPLSRAGLVISAASQSAITVSTTCVSLGTFAALAMFLLPVAYFYGGSRKDKVAWVASGLALMLALNMARMLAVASAWAYVGIGSAVALFHAFAGGIIFYATIAVMVLAAGRYGLHVDRLSDSVIRDIMGFAGAGRMRMLYAGAALSVAIGIIILAFTWGYNTAAYTPGFMLFNSSAPLDGSHSALFILGDIEAAHEGMAQLGHDSGSMIFALQNSSDIQNATYVLANASKRAVPAGILAGYGSLVDSRSVVLGNGVTLTSAIATSGNVTFVMNFFSKMHSYGGDAFLLNYEFFAPLNGSAEQPKYCDGAILNGTSVQNIVQSRIYDALKLRFGGTAGFLCNAYAVAASQA